MNQPDLDHQRLLQRPIEEDTRILNTKFVRVNETPILLEKWSADGVRGCTAVFLTDNAAAMDDVALRSFLTEKAGLPLKGSVTIVRREQHTFLNFGFEAK